MHRALRVGGVAVAAALIVAVATVVPIAKYATRIGDYTYAVQFSMGTIKSLRPSRTSVPCGPRKHFSIKRVCLDPGCGTKTEVCGKLPKIDGRRRCKRRQPFCIKALENDPATSLLSTADRALVIETGSFDYVHARTVSVCTTQSNASLAYIKDPSYGGLRCDGTPQCADGQDERNCPARTCAAADGSGELVYAENSLNQTQCAHACDDPVAFPETFRCGGSTYCAAANAVCAVYKTVCRQTYKKKPECIASDDVVFASEPKHPEKPCDRAKDVGNRAPAQTAAAIAIAVLALVVEMAYSFARRYYPVAAAATIAASATAWNAVIRPVVNTNRDCKPSRAEIDVHPAAAAVVAIAVIISISLSASRNK